MIMLFLQTLFLIAVAFALGCVAGCWLRGRMGSGIRPGGNATAGGAAADAAGSQAAPKSSAPEAAAPRPHPASVPTTSEETVAKSPGSAAAVTVADPQSGPEKSAVAKARTGAAGKPAGKAAGKTSTAAKPKSAKPSGAVATSAKPASLRSKTAKAKPAKAKPAVADNLKQIKGIGPRNEAKLNAIGVNSFAQIAAWSKKQQADFGDRLAFPGRIEREDWVKQAKVLAGGGATEFSGRGAKGDVASSADEGSAKDGNKRN